MTRTKYKEALGIELKRGKPAIGKKPAKKDLQRLYVKEKRSIRKISNLLVCTKDMVYRALKEYGIKGRDRLYKSKLNKYSFQCLENEIRKKGFKQVAVDLEVDVHTLRVHFNRRKLKERHSVA